MYYSIGKAAEALGLNPSAIRYYEKEGLLPDLKRSEAGARLLSEKDNERILFITQLAAAGFSIGEIKYLLNGSAKTSNRARLLEEKIEALETTLSALKNAKAALGDTKPADNTPKKKPVIKLKTR